MNRLTPCLLVHAGAVISCFTVGQRLDAQVNSATKSPVPEIVAAIDQQYVKRIGSWNETSFRYAAARHLHTTADGATAEFRFRGSAIAIRLGGHAVPAYGVPNLGTLVATVDGKRRFTIRPQVTPREIVVARGLKNGPHSLRIEHRAKGGTGCRIESFRVLRSPSGDLQFTISGEENAHLVDVRSVLRKGTRVIRNTIVRNWLTGQCYLAGLPPGKGYSLELAAAGWKRVRIDNIAVTANRSTTIGPIFLRRNDATRTNRFRFPALNRLAVRRPGETFRARFLGFQATIAEVKLTRIVGPARISRKLTFVEDKNAAYYYDREIIARLPKDLPPGLYDLTIQVTGGRRTGICRSPRSVRIVRKYPKDPVLVTFGHLDTSGQYQAEYLQRLVSMINLLAPDIVLNSNAVNPAYISGAMADLEMPGIVNFGNHQFPGHEKWYGDPVGAVDFGPDVCVLNFGHPWHVNRSKADALLTARPDCGHKIINAFEANAPVAWLDKHKVVLIHDAHGTGRKVMDIGKTPTRRVGKVNAASFRVVRFKDRRVVKCTYNGHATAAIPFGRRQATPLRVAFAPANDGTHDTVTAILHNEYVETFPQCRLTFVLRRGVYQSRRGRIEESIDSDDGKYTVVTVRIDAPAKGRVQVKVSPRPAKPTSNASLPTRGLCAHRGASDSHPENTLTAFREAIRLGAHMIEFDVALTKDRQLVLMHDATVNRTTNGKGKVSELTLAELKRLDAGSWKDRKFRDERIPTLDEALRMMPRNIWLNVHLKGGPKLAEAVTRRIAAHKRLHQAFLACGAEAARAAKRIDHRIKICNMERQANSLRFVDETIAAKSEFIQLLGGKSVDPAHTKRLRDHGIRINYCCVNDANKLRALFKAGVEFPLVDRLSTMLLVSDKLGIKRQRTARPIQSKARLVEQRKLTRGAATQGLALTSKHYFTSTAKSIFRYDRNWKLLQEKSIRIAGVNHIGAIDEHDGYLWAGLLHGPKKGKFDPKRKRSIIARIRAKDLKVVKTWDITKHVTWIDPVCFDGRSLWVGDLSDLGIHRFRLRDGRLIRDGVLRYPKAMHFSQGIRVVGKKLYTIHTFGSSDGLFEFDLPEKLNSQVQQPTRVWPIRETKMHLEGFDFIPGKRNQIWHAQGKQVDRYELQGIKP